MIREQLNLFGDQFTGTRFQRPKGDLTKMPRTGSRRLVVLRVIANAGNRGVIEEDLIQRLLLTPAQIQQARLELLQGCWIEDAGCKRRTSFGDLSIVWHLTPEGRNKWEASGIK